VSWLLLSIASAFLLGLYDYFKKVALHRNAVMPVLFGAVSAGALVWLPFVIWSALAPESLPAEMFHVTDLTWRVHALLFAKSALVGASWLCGYYGLESLPLSIASPIRATAPLWTILMAIAFMGEKPNARQWAGMTVILVSFFAFTAVGRREGFRFEADKSILLIVLATLLGAASALYDKHLLQQESLAPAVVQAWFSIYTALLMIPPMLLWLMKCERSAFRWRWTIPVIGLTLLLADFLYFTAIAQPDAMISLISPVRRTSVAVSFLLGIVLLRETRVLAKSLCVAGILAGVLLLA
jgi:drug/metabolite transporter (DMT)-like permease